MTKNLMAILVSLISVVAWTCSVAPVLGEDTGRPGPRGDSLIRGANTGVLAVEGVVQAPTGVASPVDESGKVPSPNQRIQTPEKKKETGRVEGEDVVPQGDVPRAPGAPKGLRVIRAN